MFRSGILDEAQSLAQLLHREGVSTGLGELHGIKDHIALGIVGLLLADLLAVDLAFQFEGEFAAYHCLVIVLLCRGCVRHRSRIGVSVRECQLAVSLAIDGMADLDAALIVILDGDLNSVDLFIVGIAGIVTGDFLDSVGLNGLAVNCYILFRELQCGKCEAAASIVLYALYQFTFRVIQAELEFIFLNCFTITSKGLGAVQGHFTLAVHDVVVNKGQVIFFVRALDLHHFHAADAQNTLGVDDIHGHFILCNGVLDEAQNLFDFLHREGVLACLREGQFVEGHLTIGIVGLFLIDLLAFQFEGELVASQRSVVALGRYRHVGHRSRVGVLVYKGNLAICCAVNGIADSDLAIVIILDSDLNGVDGIIVGVTGIVPCDLLNGVDLLDLAVHSHIVLIVLQRGEPEVAVGIIPDSFHQVTLCVIQTEPEFIFLNCFTITSKGLGALQDYLILISHHIGVNEVQIDLSGVLGVHRSHIGNSQHTALVDYRDRYFIFCLRGSDEAENAVLLLCDFELVVASSREGNGSELHITVCIVLDGLILIGLVIGTDQMEFKIATLQALVIGLMSLNLISYRCGKDIGNFVGSISILAYLDLCLVFQGLLCIRFIDLDLEGNGNFLSGFQVQIPGHHAIFIHTVMGSGAFHIGGMGGDGIGDGHRCICAGSVDITDSVGQHIAGIYNRAVDTGSDIPCEDILFRLFVIGVVCDLIGSMGIGSFHNLRLVVDKHRVCICVYLHLEGNGNLAPCCHIQTPGQRAIFIHTAIGSRAIHISSMGGDVIGDGYGYRVSGGVDVADGVQQGSARLHLLSIDADLRLFGSKYILLGNLFHSVVRNLVGGVVVCAVPNSCLVGDEHIDLVHLHLEGNGNAFILGNIQLPGNGVAQILTVVGSRTFHIRGVSRDRVVDYHRSVRAGVIGVGDTVSQDLALIDLLAIDADLRLILTDNFLLCRLVEGDIGESNIGSRSAASTVCRCAGGQVLQSAAELTVTHIGNDHTEAVLGAVIDHIRHRIGSVFHQDEEVSTGFSKLSAEGELTVLVGSSYRVLTADIKGMVSFIQRKGEGIVCQGCALQCLGAVDGNTGGSSLINIFENNVCVSLIRGSRHGSIAVIRHGNGNGAAIVVIGNTRYSTGQFLNGVGILACLGVFNGIKGEAAVGGILHHLDRCYGGIGTFIQGKFKLLRSQGTAGQSLVAADRILGGICLIVVDKDDIAACVAVGTDLVDSNIGYLQRGCIFRIDTHSYRHMVVGGVVGHAGIGARLLLYHIVVGAGLIEGHSIKGDHTIAVIFLAANDSSIVMGKGRIGLIQHKEEVVLFFQGLAFQHLLRVEIVSSSLQLVLIPECSFYAIISIGGFRHIVYGIGGNQLAVIIGNIQNNGIFLRRVSHTGDLFCRYDLLQGVSRTVLRNVGNRNTDLGIALLVGNHRLTNQVALDIIQAKVELGLGNLDAGIIHQVLIQVDIHMGGVDLVGIVEGCSHSR